MREIFTTVIVDDEFFARENLAKLLEDYCPEITIVGKAGNAKEARVIIDSQKPDALFLDVNMPGLNGFDLLDSLEYKDFCLVFVTAHSEYGIQAIKVNAVDYLLKPVSLKDLKHSVEKIKNTINNLEAAPRKAPEKTNKIVIAHFQGFSIYDCNQIVRLEASDNYTKIFFKELKPIISSKTLKDFEEILDGTIFFRIHKSHIINFNYIKEYSNVDGGIVILYDNTRLNISRRKLQEFMNKVRTQTLYLK